MNRRSLLGVAQSLALIVLTGLAATTALAHCDTMDGPVVVAAQSALEKGDVNLVLAWVMPDDEPEIRAVFNHTLEVRKLGPEAAHLADRYFFETLVRVHRAGEGAPYTGLKPAGLAVDPALAAADTALETKSANDMLSLVSNAVNEGIRTRFAEVVALSDYKPDDVAAGRRYVAAYVDYIHYVEGIYNATKGAPDHHGESAPAGEHAH